MAWLFLLLAGTCETIWAIGMKSQLFLTRFWPTLGVFTFMALSSLFLYIAIRDLPVGTAYAVWTGIGTLGATIFGIIIFNESFEWARLTCILFILLGVIGLKVLTPQ